MASAVWRAGGSLAGPGSRAAPGLDARRDRLSELLHRGGAGTQACAAAEILRLDLVPAADELRRMGAPVGRLYSALAAHHASLFSAGRAPADDGQTGLAGGQ